MIEGYLDLIPSQSYRPQTIAEVEIENDGTHLDVKNYGNYRVTLDGITVRVLDHPREKPVWDLISRAWITICEHKKDRKIKL